MDEDDLRELIAALEEQFRSIGRPDLANDTFYVERNPESGEARLPSPMQRLIMMIEAFDRFLSIQDRMTYVRAMERLLTQFGGEAPSGAFVVSTAERDDTFSQSNLANAPDLTEVRKSIALLIRQIRVQDIEPPPILRA